MSESKLQTQKSLVLGGRHGLLGQSLVNALHNYGGEVVVHGREDADVLNFSALEEYSGGAKTEYRFQHHCLYRRG